MKKISLSLLFLIGLSFFKIKPNDLKTAGITLAGIASTAYGAYSLTNSFLNTDRLIAKFEINYLKQALRTRRYSWIELHYKNRPNNGGQKDGDINKAMVGSQYIIREIKKDGINAKMSGTPFGFSKGKKKLFYYRLRGLISLALGLGALKYLNSYDAHQ
jgi:hypothetical protein